MSTPWNQQLNRYVFSKVIEGLEQNIRKHIDCNRPSGTKQMNRIEYKIFIMKYTNTDIQPGKASACSFCFY